MQLIAAHALQHALEKIDRTTGVWRGTGKSIDPATIDDGTWEQALSNVRVARDISLDGTWYVAVVDQIGDKKMTLKIEGQPDPKPWEVPRDDIKWMKGSFRDNFHRGDVIHVRRVTKGDDGTGDFVRWSVRQVSQVQGAFMAMDSHTGRVLAMQGGFSYQNSVFNRATQATRQPGSSFKPFVYAAALDSGFTPASIVIDAPIEIDTGAGIWRPHNAENKYYGPAPMRIGIEHSRNLMTVRIANEVGMDVVKRYAERFGVYDDMKPYLANALGAQETTLWRMVSAYAMFANGGERVEPTLVDRVQDRFGRTIYRHDQRICDQCETEDLPPGQSPKITSNRERMMDAITAYQLTSMMQGVVQRGTAAGAVHLGVPVAGKTGTTNGSKDVWFIGFTNNMVAGCYIGYDHPKPMPHASGGGTCAPVFQAFMTEAIKKYGAGKFRLPPGGHFIKVDRYTGARLPDDATGENVQPEYFRNGEEPVFGVMFDGGFAMGANLPLILPGEVDGTGAAAAPSANVNSNTTSVTTSTGNTVVIPDKANTGSVAAGGLY
jgi:penicillin-binding protein 1A